SVGPLLSDATLSLSGVKIAPLFQYGRDQFQFDIPEGSIRAVGKYRFTAGSALELEVSDTLLPFNDIGIVEKGDPGPVMALQTLFLDGIHADLRKRKLEIESLPRKKARHRLWLNHKRTRNILALFMPIAHASADVNPAATAGSPQEGN